MKTIITLGQIVQNKEIANVVMKVSEFDIDYTLFFNTALGELRTGKNLFLQPRTPVNKKKHICEAQELGLNLEAELNVKQEEEVEVRTIAMVQEEIMDTELSLESLIVAYNDGLIRHDVKVKTFNKLDKELRRLKKELFELQAIEIQSNIKPVEEMTREERIEAEVIARWKDRRIGTNTIETHRASDVDHGKATKNVAFRMISEGMEAAKDNLLTNRESFHVTVHDVQWWTKDKYDRVGSMLVQVPRKMMQVKQWDEGSSKYVWYPMECFNYDGFANKYNRFQLSDACKVYQQYHARYMELATAGIATYENFLTFDEWLDNLSTELGAAQRVLANTIRKIDTDNTLTDEQKGLALGAISLVAPKLSVLWFYLGSNLEADTMVSPADIGRIRIETYHFGTSIMNFAIRGDDTPGSAYVHIPKSKAQDKDEYYDLFRTRDIRFNWFNADNNHNLRAALSGFLHTLWSEYRVADPRNRNGFNEHCGNCRHKVTLQIHDQMGVDYHDAANPIDTSELGQWGSRMPQWICGVKKTFVDREVIEDLNESTSFESVQYTDEEGNLRFPRDGYVVIKGKPVSLYTIRAEGSGEECSRCPFYAKSEPKSDKRYAKEVEQAVSEHLALGGTMYRNADDTLDLKTMGIFIPKYWTPRAETNRMPVFTKHMDHGDAQWDLGFPGEFTTPTEFSVQGLGGINVFGIERVMALMNKEFVPTMEEYRAEEAQIAKLIDIIYKVSFQLDTLQEGVLGTVMQMVASTPVPDTNPALVKRYNAAKVYLAKTIQDNRTGQQVQ